LIRYFKHHKITEKCSDHYNAESSDFYSKNIPHKKANQLFYFKFQEMKMNYFGLSHTAFFVRIMPLSKKHNVLNGRKSYVITQGEIWVGV
jgi:hypothetical protein